MWNIFNVRVRKGWRFNPECRPWTFLNVGMTNGDAIRRMAIENRAGWFAHLEPSIQLHRLSCIGNRWYADQLFIPRFVIKWWSRQPSDIFQCYVLQAWIETLKMIFTPFLTSEPVVRISQVRCCDILTGNCHSHAIVRLLIESQRVRSSVIRIPSIG